MSAGIMARVAEAPAARGFSCALDTPAFRVREDEFRGLFARTLRALEPMDARAARIVLDGSCEAELRELLAREQRCCSFFEFDVEARGDAIVVTARVPAGSEVALAFLLGRAAPATV
jgi:hypothetical protein